MSLNITANLFGYTDEWQYRPGDTVALSVHAATEQDATVELVRLHSADERVTVARPLQEPVAGCAVETACVGPQPVRPGSFGLARDVLAGAGAGGLRVSCWLQPTVVLRDQGVLGLLGTDGAGVALRLENGGRLVVRVAGAEACRTAAPLAEGEWARATVTFDDTEVMLVVEGLHPLGSSPVFVEEVRGALRDSQAELHDVVLAAAAVASDDSAVWADGGSFDGKLEAVRLSRDDEVIVLWDLGSNPATDRVLDRGPHGHHAVLHNHPTRAVTGRHFSGRTLDFRQAPKEYAAVHFHEDDLDDLGWAPCARLPLPDDLPSGVYALEVRAEAGDDRIPFVVLPAADGVRPRVAFLVPTFTYQAYANARLGDRIDYAGDGLSAREYRPGPRDAQLDEHPEFAGSLYDVHSDGSGRAYSSHRRPVFNFRADYRSAVQQAYRHLGADLYLTAWLEGAGVAHDALTDHVVEAEGFDIVEPYQVIVTGSHPEYVSEEILDALQAHLARGGRIMYLGANGFYWTTSQNGHWIETRRGRGSTRTWASAPGEEHHSMTGEPGGLWRHRGRAPNRLVGIGMCSQGWDERAPGFVRTAHGRDPRRAWIFEGAEDDVFGTDGLVMGGASGDELDRHEPALGSPPEEWIVATSQPHSRYYKGVLEDLLMLRDGLGGDENGDVRSDVVCYPTAGGGAVFSVGSISWAGAMALDDYDNAVARITTNVLRRFLDAADPFET